MRATTVISTIGAILLILGSCDSFTTISKLSNSLSRTRSLKLSSDDEQSTDAKKNVEFKSNNPLELAAWYGVEAFGKVFRKSKSDEDSTSSSSAIDLSAPPSSLKETHERIQLDNDRYYFLSGEVDRLIYDEDCLFADPFVSFNGRDRFIDNLSNLGSFITNYNAKMIDYDINTDGNVINTKVMVKLELNLPWKPVLAWPWGVKYIIDPASNLVTSHIESWDIEPWEGVKQIFRKPTVTVG